MIEWVDSYGCSTDWNDLDEKYKPRPMICRSVGWLFHDGEDCKVIIPHIADLCKEEPKQGCGDMTIPTVAIISIKDIFIDTRIANEDEIF